MPNGDQQQFDPVAEARSRYPGLKDWDDQRIKQNLSDPQRFRSAFPEYAHLDDETIRRNMGTPGQAQQFAPGAIQTRKGGPVYGSAAEAAKAEQQTDRAGMDVGERVAASQLPGGELTLGAAKGLLSTGRNLGGLLTKTPILGKYLASAWPEAATGEAPEALRPHGTEQKVGFGGEQAAEFLIPGAGEEKAGVMAGKFLPQLGKAAPVLGRLGYNALTTGAVNAAQGGDFGTGALLGGGFGAVGEAGRALAPSLAESALRITDRMRGRGRTIGQAVLENTSGVRPGTIAQQSGAAIGDLTQQMEAGINRATQNGVLGSTQGAHQVLNDSLNELPRNARTIRAKLGSLHDLLDLRPEGSVGPVPSNYTPDELLEMKRGIGKEIDSWPPEWQKMSDVQRVRQRLYGAIDGELDRLVPGNAELNQKISSLIPASRQARRLSEGAPLSQRLAGRMAAHTGALAGSVGGSVLGYQRGGTPGAILGGAAGLIAPEVLASPSGQMVGARLLGSPVPQLLGRGATAQLLGRKTPFPGPEE